MAVVGAVQWWWGLLGLLLLINILMCRICRPGFAEYLKIIAEMFGYQQKKL